MIALQIIFWTGLALVFHSYVLFPAILSLMGRRRTARREAWTDGELPAISVLVPAYNEEKVIGEKLRTVLESDYPAGSVEILVGSDASTDGTNAILGELGKRHGNLKARLFETRRGKPNVINSLAAMSTGEILVITDANVLLERDTLKQLVRYFRDPVIGLIDTRMINRQSGNEGISSQEKFYIDREVRIKHHESILWGCMMGPFGGCFAVRKSCFTPVPENFLVDDFFINMSVLDQGLHCISNPEARVYEGTSGNIMEEFRRKVRISAGNFQNLRAFARLLIPRGDGIAFCFFSHKLIRWKVPFLFLATLTIAVILGFSLKLYTVIALTFGILLLIPLIDFFLRKIKIHVIPLRFITYFLAMNLALMAGFVRFIRGVKSNVWKPTERY